MFCANPCCFVKLFSGDVIGHGPMGLRRPPFLSERSRTNPRKKQKGCQAHGFDAFLVHMEVVFHAEMLLKCKADSSAVCLHKPPCLCKLEIHIHQNSQQWGQCEEGVMMLSLFQPLHRNPPSPPSKEQLTPGPPPGFTKMTD